MKQMEKDWYKKIWTLDIQNMSWVEDTKRQVDYPYGEALSKPEINEENPIRLYKLGEVSDIFMGLGMKVCEAYADFTGRPASDNDIQMMVYSRLE